MPLSLPELAKLRHDLRTPMNHVIGYAEMLLEDAMPDELRLDLERVHRSGQRLLELINLYLDDRTFHTQGLDPRAVLHDLRTPVNHILGYGEMLEERALELSLDRFVPDIRRIREAARTWLRLMEDQLAPVAFGTERHPKPEPGGGQMTRSNPIIFHPGPTPISAKPSVATASVLVVDDNAGNRDLLVRRLTRDGHTVFEAKDGASALQAWRERQPDVVLLDVQMPDLDGYSILLQAKADPALRDAAVIMVSGFDQQEGIARCIEAGAEDYLIKPFNPVLLRARVAACLEKQQLREQERQTHRALEQSQARLLAELAEAAGYVKSLLPAPLEGPIRTAWEFRPSAQLGGDAFGYHWIDERHFAVYLLDVCGHGIGAALLSVSALNVLRSQSLSGIDPRDPAAVLVGLNRAFPMEAHHQQYFTLWYGVFDVSTRLLRFSSAGHPPAFLVNRVGGAVLKPLRTVIPPIGCLPEMTGRSDKVSLDAGATLLIFSDGAYELMDGSGRAVTLADYQAWAETQVRGGTLTPETCLAFAEGLSQGRGFEDDLSLLWLQFV